MMNKKKIVCFLLFTTLITGLGWGTLYLLAKDGGLAFGQPLFMILFAIGGYGPTFATLIAIALSEGKSGFKQFLKQLFRFKVSIWYYLFTILFLLFLGFVPGLINGDPGVPLSALAEASWGIVPLFFISSFFFGGLEELGWRGLLQHELQKKLGFWIVHPIVWIIWVIWHTPLFIIPGVAQYGQNLWIFSIYALFFSVFLGWLYGRSHSIPLVVFGHTLINTFSAMGYLVFLEKETVHWATVLIVLALLVGINIFFPADKIPQE